jgi:Flp pilus assembly protein TadG
MPINRLRKPAFRCRRQAAAAVEFALVAPLFLLLLAGIIEFGQAFRIEHSLSTAARSGARAAIIEGSTTSSVTQKVQESCSKNLKVASKDVSVTISINGKVGDLSTAKSADTITVAVSIPYSKTGVGFFAHLFASRTLNSSCSFEHE